MNNRRGKKDEIKGTAQGVRWYKKRITDMVGQIGDEQYLKMIYGYVGSAYREEKSRG